MGVRLPPEYQEVEWIECTGGQYLQLDYIPEPTDIIEMVFAKNNVTAVSTDQNYTLYSAGDGTYQYVTVFTMTPNYLHTYGRYFSNVAANNESPYSIIPSPTEYTWFKHRSNGTTKAQSCEILETGRQFWISAPQKASTLSGNNTRMQVFKRVGSNANYFVGRNKYLKVTRNDETIFELVGCYRKADQKPGMYDLASGTFFTNAGTGEFVVGADVIDSISPWLVARRRLLMRKPKLDTSPRIAQYGYGLSRSNTGITKVETNCYTEWYDVDPVATYQRTMTGSGVASGGENGSCFQTKTGTGGNWDYWPNRTYLHTNSISIRFSLITSEIDNAYVYCASGGQIFFAGKNTPYYGYTNINDMPTGT